MYQHRDFMGYEWAPGEIYNYSQESYIDVLENWLITCI